MFMSKKKSFCCSVAASIRVGNMLGADQPEVAQAAAFVSIISEWIFGLYIFENSLSISRLTLDVVI